MTKSLALAALPLVLSVAATSVAADPIDQLAMASPMTERSLDSLAALKFNRDAAPSDYQSTVSARSGSHAMELDDRAVTHFASGGSEYAQGYRGVRPDGTLDALAIARFLTDGDDDN